MDEDLLEKLSDLEHKQWCEWSSAISKEISALIDILDRFEDDLTDEDKAIISKTKDRLVRWESLQIDYSELSEDVKEQDRVYARKTLSLLED